MRSLLVFFILAFFYGSAALAAPKTKVVDEQGRPPFIINLRGGFLMNNPDRAVVGRWEHQKFESYQVALSGFYSFPQAWKQVYFFFGPEFYFQKATEELTSATYTSSIDITIFSTSITGGVAYQPDWMGGDWGVSLATAFEVWGQKTADLDAQGFTQDLGTESTRPGDSSIPINLNAILTFYYDFGAFRPQLVFESNSSIGLGMAYAF